MKTPTHNVACVAKRSVPLFFVFKPLIAQLVHVVSGAALKSLVYTVAKRN